MSNIDRRLAQQAQRKKNAEKQLAQLDKLRERYIRQIEAENAKMEALTREAQQNAARMGTSSTDPPLSVNSPNAFSSQFDQFSSTPSNQRLETISPEVFGEKDNVLEPYDNAEPKYSFHDGDMHWSTLDRDPGMQVYVSGHYPASDSTKQYEYEIEDKHMPISVGETRFAPVHYKGHGDGKIRAGHDMRFVVDDIYTKEKFHPYHDTLA